MFHSKIQSVSRTAQERIDLLNQIAREMDDRPLAVRLLKIAYQLKKRNAGRDELATTNRIRLQSARRMGD